MKIKIIEKKVSAPGQRDKVEREVGGGDRDGEYM